MTMINQPKRAQTPPAPTQPHTTRALIVALLPRLRNANETSVLGYTSVAAQFLDCSGDLANREPFRYSVERCAQIRDEMLAQSNPAIASSHQRMRNLRFVLREIGMPAELIEPFRAIRRAAEKMADK